MSLRAILSRRAFLQRAGMLGGAAALFPWLRARRARAQAMAEPKLLLFYTPHGTVWDQWRPNGTETDFTLSPILEPLVDHVSRMVIVDGLEMVSGTEYYIPHTYTMPLLWTGSPIDTATSDFCRDDHMRCFGWNTGVSIDQFIASELDVQTPYPTIELGYACGGQHPASRMIYGGPSEPKSPVDDPLRAFQTFFPDLNPDMEAAARDALRRRSVLDAVRSDLGSHRGRLSSDDRARLDAHAEALRELERALVPSDVVCARPNEPADLNSETAIDRQSDMVAAVLGCGLTRIASMQVRIADNDNSLYPWVGLDAGGHHTLSHDSSDTAQMTLAQVYRWYSQRFAYLLDKLATTPDVDGSSVLDNTLVVWGSELGRAWDHDISNVPFICAGGAAGMNGGRYLQVSGQRQNRLLVSACHAMGLTEVATYGSLDNGEGSLAGLL
jgi:hypothetical protein